MNYFEIYNRESSSLFSNLIYVNAGNVLEISAFFLEGKKPEELKFEEDYITIYKNYIEEKENTCYYIKNRCCNSHFNTNDYNEKLITNSLKIMQGGSWTLTCCQNIIYIEIPGHYSLELSDKCMIGRVKVLGKMYGKNEIGHIPRDLLAGNIT